MVWMELSIPCKAVTHLVAVAHPTYPCSVNGKPPLYINVQQVLHKKGMSCPFEITGD